MLSNQCFHFESTNYNNTLERKPPVNMKKRRDGEEDKDREKEGDKERKEAKKVI